MRNSSFTGLELEIVTGRAETPRRKVMARAIARKIDIKRTRVTDSNRRVNDVWVEARGEAVFDCRTRKE